jgi:hypothetical protein
LPGDLLSFLLLASLPVGKALLFLPLPYGMKGSTAFPLRLIPSALLFLPTFASPTKLFPKIRDDSCNWSMCPYLLFAPFFLASRHRFTSNIRLYAPYTSGW